MDKLRYIDLGPVKPEFCAALTEYSRVIVPERPTVIAWRADQMTVGALDKGTRWENFVNVKAIPPEAKIIRSWIGGNANTVYILDTQTLIIHFHCPTTTPVQEVTRALLAALLKVVRSHGVEAHWTDGSNDLFMTVDSKHKKFCGTASGLFGDWRFYVLSIFLEFDAGLASKIYRFDTEKFTKKQNFTHISDAVGGLHEANPSISFDIATEVVNLIAKRFDLHFEADNLTTSEIDRLNTLAAKLKNEDWITNGRHPEDD